MTTKVMRRLVAMLARRGYSQIVAFDVVNTELAGRTGATQGLITFASAAFRISMVVVMRFMLASRVGSSATTGGR